MEAILDERDGEYIVCDGDEVDEERPWVYIPSVFGFNAKKNVPGGKMCEDCSGLNQTKFSLPWKNKSFCMCFREFLSLLGESSPLCDDLPTMIIGKTEFDEVFYSILALTFWYMVRENYRLLKLPTD